MKSILKISLIFCSLFISSMSFAGEITEESVQTLLTKMDTASKNLDADAFAKILSDDAVIVAKSMLGEKKPSKQEFIDATKRTWSVTENYKYNRTDTKTDIQVDKATASATILESGDIYGTKMSTKTKATMTIKLVNGEPLITELISQTEFLNPTSN